jgi:beta-fructofuranosidase
MSLPRTVHLLADNTLSFRPLLELKGRRKARRRTAPANLVGNVTDVLVPYVGSRCVEAAVSLLVNRAGRCGVRFVFGANGDQVEIGLDPRSVALRVDISKCGFAETITRTAPVAFDGQGMMNFHVILDASCLEVFGDQGRTVLSMRLFPRDPDACRLEAFSRDGADVLVQADVWELG